jgi:D-alanyl-lipoteichoic acid acyltransferase DltB (MBOAT superfamily)
MYYLFGLFVLSVVLFYSITNKYQSYILFASSLLFIAAFSDSIAVFSLAFTIINYFLGIFLEKYRNNRALKNKLFWLSILVDVGILVFFKYFISYFENLNFTFFSSGIYSKIPYQSIMIPIGISYYTFQALGYLIRIDRGIEKAEHNFFIFATFLLFFPKFLSGPVERSNHFLPQLNNSLKFDKNNFESGIRLFSFGLFKKIVIADNLYGAVLSVYGDVYHYTGAPLLIVLIVQAIYIYSDFSGYTDMALGISKMFGINLIDNFNRPFLARNISEFWRRWHLSLSSWCNDFIYTSFIVKFRRWKIKAVIFGIFLTFFIVGIWHGANLTFVILGLLQGIAIVYEFYTRRIRLRIASRLPKNVANTLSRIIVFLFMAFSMIFFFANSVKDASYFILHLFRNIHFNLTEIDFIDNKPEFLIALIFFLLLFIIEMLIEKGKNLLLIYLKQPILIRGLGYFTLLFLTWLFYSGIHTFYYMRF